MGTLGHRTPRQGPGRPGCGHQTLNLNWRITVSKLSPRCKACPTTTPPHWAHLEVWTPDGWIASGADGTVRHFAEVIEPLVDSARHRADSIAPKAWIQGFA